MIGAREYSKYFKTGQYGKLYVVSGSHARGKTFNIYVLPDGVKAKSNGPNNAPLNNGSVKVYGVVSGNIGWTESYGWLHKGKWVEDFNNLYKTARAEKERQSKEFEEKKLEKVEDKNKKDIDMLSNY